jgi:hypothetical protein
MKLTPFALGITLAIVGINFMDYRFYVVLIPTMIASAIDNRKL